MHLSIPLIPISEPNEEDGAANKDPRVNPPFEIDIDWKSRRERARKLELVAGFTAYFSTTGEGRAIVVATIIGIVGSYFVIRALSV